MTGLFRGLMLKEGEHALFFKKKQLRRYIIEHYI
jgi:hypothetical protein